MNNIIEFVKTANATTAPPSAIDPVSPINILAGKALNPKNPIQAPAVAAASIATSVFDIDVANIMKNAETIKVTPYAKPSSQSVKLTAFTIPTIINVIIGI